MGEGSLCHTASHSVPVACWETLGMLLNISGYSVLI